MKYAVVLCGLLISLAAVILLDRDPSVQAEEEPAEVDQQLLARVEALEDLVSFHNHERELEGIIKRLQQLEAAQGGNVPEQPLAAATSQPPSPQLSGELNKLRQDVQSLSSKLAALERTISPLKQDVSKLKLSMTRVESSVARIDLRR